MKIHISFKLTQCLKNIFKMRFLMINCLKYAQQCQSGIFKKICQATTVPYSVLSMGNPLIPDAEKHFVALLLSEFKNRYVKANINL